MFADDTESHEVLIAGLSSHSSQKIHNLLHAIESIPPETEILAFAGIGPGMVVADLMAGQGWYSEVLSRVVGPEGRVYLQNNFPYKIRAYMRASSGGYVYPAEPIKGIWAIPTAVILHSNPLKATTVHCNWLWPSRVRALAEPVGFNELHHEFNLLSSPQFVSLFQLG